MEFRKCLNSDKPDRKAAWISIFVISLLFLPASVYTLYIIKDVETAASEFRGFLLKRLSHKVGFRIANIIQSSLFGLLHGILFFGLTGILKAIIIILLTGASAFAMGYVNERKANGSILPSWFIHALSNIFAAGMAMFSVI